MRRDPRLALAFAISISISAIACGSKPVARSCSNVEKSAREKVELSWEIEHGGMEEDPPRPKVTLVLKSPRSERIELGTFEGICKMAEVGIPPDDVYGTKVTELVCVNGGVTMFASVVFAEREQLVIRRYEKGEASEDEPVPQLKNVRKIGSLAVPSCPTFAVEFVNGGGL